MSSQISTSSKSVANNSSSNYDKKLTGTNKNDNLSASNESTYIDGKKGNDKLTGGSKGDFFRGRKGKDKLVGQKGDDIFEAGEGNDTIQGNGGSDSVIFKGSFSDYKLNKKGKNWKVSAKNQKLSKSLNEGNDTFKGVESLVFADGTYALSKGDWVLQAPPAPAPTPSSGQSRPVVLPPPSASPAATAFDHAAQ